MNTVKKSKSQAESSGRSSVSSCFYEARSTGARSTGRSSIDSCTHNNSVVSTSHTQVPTTSSKLTRTKSTAANKLHQLIRRQTTPANIGQVFNSRPSFLNLNDSLKNHFTENITEIDTNITRNMTKTTENVQNYNSSEEIDDEFEPNSSFRSVLRNGQVYLVSESFLCVRGLMPDSVKCFTINCY